MTAAGTVKTKRFLIERTVGRFTREIELSAVDGDDALRLADALFSHEKATPQYRVNGQKRQLTLPETAAASPAS